MNKTDEELRSFNRCQVVGCWWMWWGGGSMEKARKKKVQGRWEEKVEGRIGIFIGAVRDEIAANDGSKVVLDSPRYTPR